MEYDRFESIIKELEDYSQKHPKLYKFKVFLLGTLGYVYAFGILLLVLAVVVGIYAGTVSLSLSLSDNVGYLVGHAITQWLAVPLFGVIWIILKGFWIRIYPPEGIEITKKEFKELFDTIEKIRKQLKAKKIHKVLLNEEFNASVYRHPKFGIFGNCKNYLIIGVPLIMHLSKDELDAVIAHEIAHISKEHSKITRWIIMVKDTWENISSNIEEKKRRTRFLYKRFLDIYEPYLDAYTFVLQRGQEYEADNLAGIVVGTETIKNSILSLEIGEQTLDLEFWPKINRQIRKFTQPPNNVYDEMKKYLYKTIPEDKMIKYINKGLKRNTDLTDTHPSPKNRILNLNESSNYNKDCSLRASEEYLGKSLDNIIDILNKQWKDNISDWWVEEHRETSEGIEQLEKLKKDVNNLSIDEKLFMGVLEENYGDIDEAINIYKDIIEIDNEYAEALYRLGVIQIQDDNKEGIEFIEKAMKIDIRYTIDGCYEIYKYLINNGKSEQAKRYYKKAEKYEKLVEMATEERSNITYYDKFLEHKITDDNLNKLEEFLKKYEEINKVYLVRKELKYLTQYPLYVIFLELKSNVKNIDYDEFFGKLNEEIDFLKDNAAMSIESDDKEIQGILSQINGCKVYDVNKIDNTCN
ncbi:hypothetical protein CLPU_13c00270 [Gottschalkia purinilytica]|uniref:Peptidase M48 domain-containing protein n=1 Tax=Gottschalkia purinilytica TaxID=1503 RepID=A0A0L0W8R8_GOTPU|nr:M48 family metalloprotease [Gottschalkia purinilytica]KNF07685.1 hypothetical protein CLPU_13c00270 [Gottschalkia purinilytica]